MTKETVKTDGTVYEVGYHIVPAVSPDNLSAEVDAIKAVLGKNGATIIGEEAPQLIPLAYQMVKPVGQARMKCDTAYFGWIKFEAAPAAAVEINKALSASEKILRFLLVKTVRESVIYGTKFFAKEEGGKADAPKAEVAKADKPKATDEEIDKSIDKLVA